MSGRPVPTVVINLGIERSLLLSQEHGTFVLLFWGPAHCQDLTEQRRQKLLGSPASQLQQAQNLRSVRHSLTGIVTRRSRCREALTVHERLLADQIIRTPSTTNSLTSEADGPSSDSAPANLDLLQDLKNFPSQKRVTLPSLPWCQVASSLSFSMYQLKQHTVQHIL